jgi:succinate dehydrogenase/fumarate reductase flavoprotein subunit
MNQLQADVLVVGGGTGGTAAALQAARRGAKTILVSQCPMLGGMLTY